ncbi:hypothetical protein CJD36_009465 [Flavipsychrobacter stenotrophus]|uniref:DUF2892 domain-containing protein n=1 Tax=Flavipsychrobacter stenotrophus TaxID=2077091 RepID=A0A2S7SZG1_9BACT|nr:hypothetical protein [Flavipsychrobacter stenotrophus]PQJ12007.1 hypothetical protein CJD36_009465 [Flavipsychrobacter stenotrophus]
MSSIKESLLTNWSLIRIVRLAIGIWMVGMGIQSKDWAVGLFGGFFLYQAVTNTGCCGSGACYTPPRGRKFNREEPTKEIEYEEVK